jgi:UDP:flavonoid glycosyltransferase YjiC (YdhE family)
MRVLFSCRPFYGHFLPMVPLARASVAVGHEVAFASGEPMPKIIGDTGFVAFGAGLSVADWQAEVGRRFGNLQRIPGHEQRAWAFRHVFTDIEAPPRIRALLDIIDNWQPDVLVHDMAEFAGPLAAALRRIPCATFGYGPFPDQALVETGTEGMRAHWQAAGLDPGCARIKESLYFDPCPPSLQVRSGPQLPSERPIRPEFAENADGSESVISGFPDRPTVYVTLGTFFNRDPSTFAQILTGLAHAPVNVIVTLGPDLHPDLLPVRPSNARFLQYVPQAQILHQCQMVICHGGWGSLIGALSAGLPVLALPRGADHFVNAQQLVTAGAGRTLEPSEVDPERIAPEVQLLLCNGEFRRNATRISDEIADMPSPSDGVSALEDVVATHSAGRMASVDAI